MVDEARLMSTQIQTVTLEDKTFVILEQSEYERLRTLASATDNNDLPTLPAPDADGNFPAIPYARTSLARKIIRRRRTVGLTQAQLAKKAGIRPETLNRIERGKSSPAVSTIEKIVCILERVEAEKDEP